MGTLKPSILLISGGMDSICLAYWKRPSMALIIDYGQVAYRREFAVSKYICDALCIELHTSQIKLPEPSRESKNLTMDYDWIPFRNQILVTLAGVLGIRHGIRELMIGTVKSDRKFLDGSPDFISNMNSLLNSQEGGIQLVAPAIEMTTCQLFKISDIPMYMFAGTYSCTEGDIACGHCSSCIKHAEVMACIDKEIH